MRMVPSPPPPLLLLLHPSNVCVAPAAYQLVDENVLVRAGSRLSPPSLAACSYQVEAEVLGDTAGG